jgi:excisionase family DNA binding protein
MLTMMEAAELIHCSRSQIYRLMQMPQFPKFRVNSMVRIPRAAFLDWIDKHSEGTESDEG